MKAAVIVSNNHPVLVDKYIPGKEVETDGISEMVRMFLWWE